MPSADYLTRVDDAILIAAANLSRLRDQPLHASIRDFRQSSVENVELSLDGQGRPVGDHDLWRLRIDRCDLMLANPDDVGLRRRLADARDRDRA